MSPPRLLADGPPRSSSTTSRRSGHTEVAQLVAGPAQRPDAAVHQRRDEPVQGRFTGQRKPRFPRATTSQKCVRAGGKHNDLENVGRTARHHTFFEMLGNFSFGDYFKPDAIAFAHELLTKVYGIDPKPARLHGSRVRRRGARRSGRRSPASATTASSRLGDKDNFWAMGETGPCGPCSEIHYLQGDDIPCADEAAGRQVPGPGLRLRPLGRDLEPGLHAVRAGRRPAIAARCPSPSVDTGMGLERLCAVLQGVRSNYETDLLRPLIDRAAAAVGQDASCPTDYEGTSVSLRAIADHARAAAFLIADGVFPDKTGREYVLRRIMRRAVYHGWLLGIEEPFLRRVAGDVIDEDGRRLSRAAASARA